MGRQRSPGQRHPSNVPEYFVAVYRGDQVLKGAVHDLGPVFWVERAGRRGGPGDVAKKHGHNAALACMEPPVRADSSLASSSGGM